MNPKIMMRSKLPRMDDFTAPAAQPHCPSCGTVLTWDRVSYVCKPCGLNVLPER